MLLELEACISDFLRILEAPLGESMAVELKVHEVWTAAIETAASAVIQGSTS